MSWLAWDTRAYLGAFVGLVLAWFSFGALYDAGHFAPWVFGVLAGVGAAAVTGEKALVRGFILATLATWTAAVAQVLAQGGGFGQGLLAFHESLTPGRFALYAIGFAVALFVGGSSFRPGATKRPLGA